MPLKPTDEIEVRDERRKPRHAIVYYEDWNTARFRSLTPAARLLYVELAMYAGGGERASWLKAQTLADDLGFSPRTIYNLVRDLKRNGYVKVGKKRFGLSRVSVYTLLSPPSYPLPPDVP